MQYSSESEVELRAATVVIVDRIFKKIQSSKESVLAKQVQFPYQVDWVLWQMGESIVLGKEESE
jgi:hypothetical protein